MSTVQAMIDNYINGNLTDAKRQARHRNPQLIKAAFVTLAGYSERRAALTAHYLKTGNGFQAACDAQ